jgi:hypothetical protein
MEMEGRTRWANRVTTNGYLGIAAGRNDGVTGTVCYLPGTAFGYLLTYCSKRILLLK